MFYKKIIKIILGTALFSCILSSVVYSETNDTLTQISAYKDEADQILHQQILPNIKVAAQQNNITVTNKDSSDNVVVNTVSYEGLADFNNVQNNTTINFNGSQVTPHTPIIISFNRPQILAKKTIANQDGNWAVNININSLPSGKNLAYVQADKNGTRSDAVIVASFMVTQDNQITASTWYFIIFTIFAVIILLFAIILQLKRNAQDLEPGQLI